VLDALIRLKLRSTNQFQSFEKNPTIYETK
jgi:hypothetical protein